MVTIIVTDDIARESVGSVNKPDYTLRDVSIKATFEWVGESSDRMQRFFRPKYAVECYKEVSQADLNGYVVNCRRDLDKRIKQMDSGYAQDLCKQLASLHTFMETFNPGSHIYMKV